MKKYLTVAVLFGILLMVCISPVSASIEGDAYADSVLTSRSAWYSNGDNALGAPDGMNATILVDYGYGYITVDMGLEEEIIDGSGNDFTVIASGSYRVGVAATLEEAMNHFPAVNDTQNFDLDSLGLTTARYVKIELTQGTSVELDAIQAINYNTPSDEDDPAITPLNDITLEVGQYNTTLQWEADDDHPDNYTILIDDVEELSEAWDGSDIEYTASFMEAGTYTVTLVLYDAFGNSATDSVVITVVGEGSDITLVLIAGVGAMAVFAIVFIVLMKKRSVS